MKSRLIFTLCSSSSFCFVFPLFQFPSKTNFSATPSFLNAFSQLLPHTPLSQKKKNPLPFKMKTPLPAFTCSLFIPSCKSSPVPGISPSPSLTTTMARCGVYGHMSQHARLFQKPAPTLPKMLPALLGL